MLHGESPRRTGPRVAPRGATRAVAPPGARCDSPWGPSFLPGPTERRVLGRFSGCPRPDPEARARAMTLVSARTAQRTHVFTESVIREMTRVAQLHNAINLSQGFPDFAAPDFLKEEACRAIMGDVNQYAITWGTPRLRDALVRKYSDWYGIEVEGDREITVTCGATEAMAAVMLAVIDPGDEVIVMEPFYENYGPDAVLCGAAPVYLTLEAPGYEIDGDRLRSLITPRTRAIVLNTPNNPTGRVFTRDEMETIASVCREHDLLAITDEIYERILYQGEHIPLAT